MGKYFSLFLLLFLFVNCSPKLAEIQGKSISKNDFFRILSKKDPRYFGKKISKIENKLIDWKRLKPPLMDYLNDEAIHKELLENKFYQSINKKEMDFWHYGALAEYTYILVNKKVTFEELQKKEKALLFNSEALKKAIKENTSLKTVIRLSQPEEFILSKKELENYYQENKVKMQFYKWVDEVIIPQLYLSLEGYRREYNKELLFIEYWQMKKRKKLIALFEIKKKKELRDQIILNRENELKALFEKEKDKFVHYTPNKEDKQKLGEKYQYTYNRVREDLINRLVDKDLLNWKQKLKEKYSIKISNEYFDYLSEEESKKIEEKMKAKK